MTKQKLSSYLNNNGVASHTEVESPKGIIVKSEDKPSPSKCIACGICVKSCPQEILEIVEVAD